MNYHWIENIRDFHNISQKWDQLLLASGSDNPFLLSDFIITWWKYYHPGKYLRILVIDDGNKIIGGIPLYLRNESWKRGFLKTLYYIGDGAANYTEPLFLPSKDFWPIFLNALESKKDWNLLHLFNVRGQSNLVKEFNPKLLNSKTSVRLIQDHLNWAIDLSGGIENYFKRLSKKLRRDLNSRRRRASQEYGEIRLKEIKDVEELKSYFDLYGQFSRKSFNARNERSAFNNYAYVQFFKDFLILMHRNQRLYAHVLCSGDKVFAISFGYKLGKGFNWALTAYDYDYRSIRPGYLLIEELIKEVSSWGEIYYNWYGYHKFYKTQWCNIIEPLYRIKVFKKNIYTDSLHYIEENVRRIRQSYVRQ